MVQRITLYTRITLTIIAFGALLFLPAGTVYWVEGWIFLIILSGYIIYSTVWLMKNNPELLKERLRIRKTQKWDKVILFLFSICFVALFVIPGFDFRYHWTHITMPVIVKATAFAGVCISLIIIFLVTKENTYAFKAIKIKEKHTVVTTGPYQYVRHPLYAGGLLFIGCMPLALGSLSSFIPGVMSVVLFVIRTYLEDTMLYKELPGYRDYAQKTRYRLIPKIW
jgi:protein-S-isoprenylcysteine O-methyltransferase Ste14